MYVIRVTAHDNKNLSAMMLAALRHRRVFGLLEGLIHAKDDVVQEVDYGFEMTSCWSTPEETQDIPSTVYKSMVYTECLAMAIDMLYDCRECDNWPEINVVLGRIEERLEGLE